MSISPEEINSLRQSRLTLLEENYQDYFYLTGTEAIAGLGSCFGFNVLKLLQEYHFNIINYRQLKYFSQDRQLPTGPLYSPNGILSCLQASFGELPTPMSLKKIHLKEKKKAAYFYYQRQESDTAHEPYPFVLNIPLNKTKRSARSQLDELLTSTRNLITDADVLIITLGTAYEFLINGISCIKSANPEENMQYRLFSHEECRNSIIRLIEYVLQKNQTVRIILTVSPMYHTNRIWEQNLQKSRLLSACYEALDILRTNYLYQEPEIQQRFAKYKKVALFGSGQCAENIIQQAGEARKKIVGIIDDYPEKQRSQINGFQVYSPEDVHKLKLDFQTLLIASSYHQEILTRLPGIVKRMAISPKIDLLQRRFCYFPSFEIIQQVAGLEALRGSDNLHISDHWIHKTVFPFFEKTYLKYVTLPQTIDTSEPQQTDKDSCFYAAQLLYKHNQYSEAFDLLSQQLVYDRPHLLAREYMLNILKKLNRPIVIWGNSERYRKLLQEHIPDLNVKGFIVSDCHLWGKQQDNLVIYSPSQLVELKPSILVICTDDADTVKQQVKAMNINASMDIVTI